VTGRATAPTVAVVAQIPALATVALITQYSTLLWFVAGLAVFSQSRAAEPAAEEPPRISPEMVNSPGGRPFSVATLTIHPTDFSVAPSTAGGSPCP
jgi:hypothetical protein